MTDTCLQGTPLYRDGKRLDDECLNGVSAYEPLLAHFKGVFTGQVETKKNLINPFETPTVEPLDDDVEYLKNFITNLRYRPCAIAGLQPIVEQTIFHFLCKTIPPPSASGLTETDITNTINRLYRLFVNNDKYNHYKDEIKKLKVLDHEENEVPVLEFRSFKDGKTALETAMSLQNDACLNADTKKTISKKELENKGRKVEEIILAIDPDAKKQVRNVSPPSEDEDEGHGTWKDSNSEEASNEPVSSSYKYKIGDKLVLKNGKTVIVDALNGNDTYTANDETFSINDVKRKALWKRGGKKTKRSLFLYKKRNTRSRKTKKQNRITKRRQNQRSLRTK